MHEDPTPPDARPEAAPPSATPHTSGCSCACAPTDTPLRTSSIVTAALSVGVLALTGGLLGGIIGVSAGLAPATSATVVTSPFPDPYAPTGIWCDPAMMGQPGAMLGGVMGSEDTSSMNGMAEEHARRHGGAMPGCAGMPMPATTSMPMTPDTPADPAPLDGSGYDLSTNPQIAEIAEELASAGVPIERAARVLDDLGLTWRVTSIDGQGQAATMDYSPDRLNLEITDGIVTGATLG